MEGCTRVKTRLIMRTSGLPLYNCKNIVDFFKGMYDILEAHRWMVAEHNLLHCDISHGNIIVEAKDTPNIKEFTDTNQPAPPMARLLDMDNCAKLNTLQAQTTLDGDEINGPLRCRTSDIAGKYNQAYHDNSSELRTFSDANRSTHGGHPHYKGMHRFQTDPDFGTDLFKHQPFHDAESVYWCIVAFVLPAKPLKNEVDENQDAFNEMWTCLMEHEVGNTVDTRYPFMQVSGWDRWLHKDLSFIADLMVALTFRAKPEWALLTPTPHPLHLHEAMQWLILQHVHDWETKRLNVDLDTVSCRTFTPFERIPITPVSKHPFMGQIITLSTLGKRRSNSFAGRAQSGSKRHISGLRKTGDNEPLDADLAELQQAWIDSQSTPVAPEPLEYTLEDEDEETSE
ncbi:hypothetical protein BDN71DRAFT_1433575 [Pleurotus eryngii]|uniref:Fungal-type protein kinase domain-containing protein n=1 Tax=Pleurotus eryngii TaxID=5323 RepID=A0A9P5ZTB9_PLEER|nr:hypothetical protein BDN71DRAFT_1433575 [Pleurotus eryngii]